MVVCEVGRVGCVGERVCVMMKVSAGTRARRED